MNQAQGSSSNRVSRRQFVAGLGTGVAVGGLCAYGLQRWQDQLAREAPVYADPGTLGMPGKYRGKVVEVHHDGACEGNVRNREAVKSMIARGMQELVGSDDAVEAWRSFFTRGDRVGIKVVPVGKPHSISSYEVIHELVAALEAANVRRNDILVFERYEDDFRAAKYPENLPDGVHWECSSFKYDETQVRLDGQADDAPRSKHVAGYDRDIYRTLAYCNHNHDPQDDRRFRSHLSLIISQKIDKFISIPVLKDHRTGGVTLCLKNLSHGSVNNVCRSHSSHYKPGKHEYRHGTTLNQCGTFIPSMASLPKIREKAVLQILDGLVGTYEGGPGNWNKTFATWNQNSLYFGTDPVAIDHIGWEAIDKKRAEEGWPSVAKMGLESEFRWLTKGNLKVPSEQFHMRQPEHIPLAATLGLGEFTRHLIDHRLIDLS